MHRFCVQLIGPAIVTLLLSGCSDPVETKGRESQNFGFEEIEQIAGPLTDMASTNSLIADHEVLGRAPHIARIYSNALIRFEGIYGQGVGSARGHPKFMKCIATFHDVNALIKDPKNVNRTKTKMTGAALAMCTEYAGLFQQETEIATFGNDFMEMIRSAAFTLRYATISSAR